MSKKSSKPAKAKLRDLKTTRVTFRLENTGNHLHEFRKFTLDDEAWVEEELGLSLQELLDQMQIGKGVTLRKLAKVWLRILVDPSPFAPEEKVVRNPDSGVVDTRLVTGSEKLMQAIAGPEEADLVTRAFLKLVVRSMPPEEEIAAQKKTPTEKPIGEPSLTPSQASTGGPGITSSP